MITPGKGSKPAKLPNKRQTGKLMGELLMILFGRSRDSIKRAMQHKGLSIRDHNDVAKYILDNKQKIGKKV